MEPKYKRVLLKISGEALAGADRTGLNDDMLQTVAEQVREVHDLGVQVAIVVGGGNFWRGRTSASMDRATADYTLWHFRTHLRESASRPECRLQ